MESQPQNPEFRINPENFHPCMQSVKASVMSPHIHAVSPELVPLSLFCMPLLNNRS